MICEREKREEEGMHAPLHMHDRTMGDCVTEWGVTVCTVVGMDSKEWIATHSLHACMHDATDACTLHFLWPPPVSSHLIDSLT